MFSPVSKFGADTSDAIITSNLAVFFHITKTSLLLRRCYCTTVFRLAGQSALGLATPYSPAGESTTATYVTTLSRAAELPDASTGAALLVGAGA